MGIKDFLKKRKKDSETKKEEKEKEVEKVKEKKADKKAPLFVIEAPHITEKSTELAKQNQYVFRVTQNANKIQIKKAIENLYNVDVLDVRVLKVPPKKRRLGRVLGEKKGYKKAIIKIKEGQKIDIFGQ